MAQFRTTLVLIGILVALGAFLYFIDLPRQEEDLQTQHSRTTLLTFDDRRITHLTVQTPTGRTTLSLNPDQEWVITHPIPTDADKRQVQGLLRAITLGRVTRVIEEHPPKLEPFGLESPFVTLSVTAGPHEETLRLGDIGPIRNTLYAFRQSDQTVLLTTLAPKDFIHKTFDTLRRKEILRFHPANVQRVRLTYPSKEFVLYRRGQGRKATWRLRAPMELAADQLTVKGLLVTLQMLKASGFVDSESEHDAMAETLTNPAVTITLHMNGTDHVLRLFHGVQARAQAFAETEPGKPLYRINPLVLRQLTKDLFALRDKRLLGIAPEDLALLEVITPTRRFDLVRPVDAWRLDDRPEATLNRHTVELFVSRVSTLPAEHQTPESEEGVAARALATPAAEFLGTTRQGTRARLTISHRQHGLAYARGHGLPGTVQVRADILDQIPALEELLDQPEQPRQE